MSGQFRMRRLQVYNWGTFSGLHDIPISERGFLIVGPSGAGKSEKKHSLNRGSSSVAQV